MWTRAAGLFLVLACLLSSSFAAVVPQTQETGEYYTLKENKYDVNENNRIDPALKHILDESDERASLEVIVQFADREIENEDIQWLANKGIVSLRQTEVVPSILARGSAAAIHSFSG